MFEVVPVKNGMIGGHFAVQDVDGKVIGANLNMDIAKANILSGLLLKAFRDGQKVSGLERACPRP